MVVVQARRTTNYTLTGTFTNITLDTTDVENNAAIVSHDNTNTDRIYVYQTGLYLVHYHADASQGTSLNDYDFQVFKNATSVVPGSAISGRNSSTDKGIASVDVLVELTSNDYITLQARFPVNTGAIVSDIVFSVTKLRAIYGSNGTSGVSGADGGSFTLGLVYTTANNFNLI